MTQNLCICVFVFVTPRHKKSFQGHPTAPSPPSLLGQQWVLRAHFIPANPGSNLQAVG